MLEQIGQDNVEVSNVYPEAVDRHSYEFTSKDLSEISDSDIVVYISESEDSVIHNLGETDEDDTKYINLSDENDFTDLLGSDLFLEEVVDDHEHEDEGDEHAYEDHADEADDDTEFPDNHIWITPNLNMYFGDFMTDYLSGYDPDNSSFYEENYAPLKVELERLDQEYQEFADNQTKSLIITHDAYYYYNYYYGIDYVTAYGEHHDDEPTAKDLENIITLINDNELQYIIYEDNDETNQTMKQIQNETGVDNLVMTNLSTKSTNSEIENLSIVELLEYNLTVMENAQK